MKKYYFLILFLSFFAAQLVAQDYEVPRSGARLIQVQESTTRTTVPISLIETAENNWRLKYALPDFILKEGVSEDSLCLVLGDTFCEPVTASVTYQFYEKLDSHCLVINGGPEICLEDNEGTGGSGTDDQTISVTLVGCDLTIQIEDGNSQTVDICGINTDDQQISGTEVGLDINVILEDGGNFAFTDSVNTNDIAIVNDSICLFENGIKVNCVAIDTIIPDTLYAFDTTYTLSLDSNQLNLYGGTFEDPDLVNRTIRYDSVILLHGNDTVGYAAIRLNWQVVDSVYYPIDSTHEALDIRDKDGNISLAGVKLGVGAEDNISVGELSLQANTAGDFNIGIGKFALGNNTEGSNNISIGRQSGLANTTGELNVFVGDASGISNTEGSFNTFVGDRSGGGNTTGSQNTAVGHQAGRFIGSGLSNTYIGSLAGFNATGSENAFGGADAGREQLGNQNTAFGKNALEGEIGDSYTLNSAFGYRSGRFVDGNNNSVFGSNAGESFSGDNNSIFGYQAAQNSTALTDAVIIGREAGQNYAGTRPILLGTQAGETGTGQDLIAIGRLAGQNVTTAGNIMIGVQAGQVYTGTSPAVYIGQFAGRFSTGLGNTFLGYATGANVTAGTHNTYVGSTAGSVATSSGNTVVGSSSYDANNSGDNNTVVGYNAMGDATTSQRNVVIGHEAANNMSSGDDNVIIGDEAALRSTGSRNVVIGATAADDVVSQTHELLDDVIIGYDAFTGADGTKNTIIGSQAGASSTTGSVVLGYGSDINSGDYKLAIGVNDGVVVSPRLIGGDFEEKFVRINDTLKVTSLTGTGNRNVAVSDDGTLIVDGSVGGGGDPDQTLSVNGNDLTISGTGGNTVTLPGSTPQDLSLTDGGFFARLDLSQSSDQIFFSGGTPNVNVEGLGNAVSISVTESQTLSINGSDLSISGGNTVTLPLGGDSRPDTTAIDIGGSTVYGTPDNPISFTPAGGLVIYNIGNDITFQIPNYTQDPTLTGNNLGLTGTATTVDLSPYLDNTDAQTLSINGSDLTISGGNTVTLPAGGGGVSVTGSDDNYTYWNGSSLVASDIPTFYIPYSNGGPGLAFDDVAPVFSYDFNGNILNVGNLRLLTLGSGEAIVPAGGGLFAAQDIPVNEIPYGHNGNGFLSDPQFRYDGGGNNLFLDGKLWTDIVEIDDQLQMDGTIRDYNGTLGFNNGTGVLKVIDIDGGSGTDYKVDWGSVAWSEISGIPAGFADGVDNTSNLTLGSGQVGYGTGSSITGEAGFEYNATFNILTVGTVDANTLRDINNSDGATGQFMSRQAGGMDWEFVDWTDIQNKPFSTIPNTTYLKGNSSGSLTGGNVTLEQVAVSAGTAGFYGSTGLSYDLSEDELNTDNLFTTKILSSASGVRIQNYITHNSSGAPAAGTNSIITNSGSRTLPAAQVGAICVVSNYGSGTTGLNRTGDDLISLNGAAGLTSVSLVARSTYVCHAVTTALWSCNN